MRARALRSFVPPNTPGIAEGEIVDVPDGADWVEAGLVEPLDVPKPPPPAPPPADVSTETPPKKGRGKKKG